tara:strand:- start:1253 stop:2374 length:1122 start_codon:yes stop_codon:yes gene_type:complete
MSKAREVAKMGEVLTNNQIGGRRNIIINGAMMVAQRSTSTQFSNSSGFVCDRYECSVSTNAAVTFSQSTDVPSGQGFINSTKINVDTADSSIGASEHSLFQQKVEGLNSSQLMWGTSNAENISVSFWIKSSLTGTFTYYALDQGANSQSYVQTFTIDSANTWEKKTFIIEGPTTGGTTDFPITNARSFFTGICLGVGTTHQTSTTGSWHSTANFAASTSSAVKLIGTANANMYVTGWQIELGNQVTPFEHRSFGEELALCQRYLNIFGKSETGNNYENFGTVVAFGTGNGDRRMQMTMPTTMRAIPTVTHSGAFACLGQVVFGSSISIGLADGGSKTIIGLNLTGTQGDTVGDVSPFRSNNDADAFISFDAEL